MRTAVTIGCGLLVSAALASGGPPPLDPAWQHTLASYVRNPARGAHALLALDRAPHGDLPPHVWLLLGDAALRTGRLDLAVSHFHRVADTNAGEPWTGWARLALGWTATARGDAEAARVAFQDALGSPESRVTAQLALAVVAAADDAEEARRLVADAGQTLGATAAQRNAGLLITGYAAYWAGDLTAARSAFTALTTQAPGSPLADDATYAVALTWRDAGDDEAARAILRALAETPRAQRTGSGRDDVTPQHLMRDALRRYRRSPLLPPDRQFLAFLDGDGARRARAALAREDADAAEPPHAPAASTTHGPAPGAGARTTRSRPAEAGREGRWLAVTLLALALAGGGLHARRRRTLR